MYQWLISDCSELALIPIAWNFCSALYGLDEPLPLHILNWATCSLTGACSWVHTDTSGFATAIWMVAGGKVWYFADNRRMLDLDHIPKNFKPHVPSSLKMEYDGIVTYPGDYL